MDLFPPPLKTIQTTNAPELSVSDLAGAIKHTIEGAFERVRVRGELSKVARPASGHIYTTLKDDSAVIDAVCWRTQIPRLRVKPEEGIDVIITGRITTYPARSTYQLIIEQIELAGIGAILKMIEDRRIKLAAEGLFDEERKRALPFAPRTIGVITSPTGAVIRDILHRLSDRFPVHVIIWPVAVQGEHAAKEIARAITRFNELNTDNTIPRPDILIIARGGGSIEDLMPFNDEALVRAAAASNIPLISAVGHETDTTLIDYASDKRAPTPTAAAEFSVPVHADLVETVNNFSHRLHQGWARRVREWNQYIASFSAHLKHPEKILDLPIQLLDHTGIRLDQTIITRLERLRGRLNEGAARIRHPIQKISESTRILILQSHALTQAAENLTRNQIKRLEQSSRMLETLSFHKILQRGFALVKDDSGNILRYGSNIAPNQNIHILFSDKIEKSATIKN